MSNDVCDYDSHFSVVESTDERKGWFFKKQCRTVFQKAKKAQFKLDREKVVFLFNAIFYLTTLGNFFLKITW